ncbi:hypothetical protein DWF04_021530 [Cereibacter sphaeroides f. sp. denitrificans]
MVVLSAEFRALASKVYTFSFLCLAAKFLNVTSITQQETKIEFESSAALSGALASVAVLLTVAATSKLLSDWVRTKVADEVVVTDEALGVDVEDLMHDPSRRRTFSERSFAFIKATAFLSFVLEAIVPLLVGVGTALYALQDIVEFARLITN